MTSFPSRFPGQCADCGEGIVPPEPIRHTEDGYTHATCNDPLGEDNEKNRATCPNCWLQRSINGSCGCDQEDEQ